MGCVPSSGITEGQRCALTPGLHAASSASPRARLRAAIITFFLLFNTLAALPTPGEASAERLQRPFEREELRRWLRLFRAVGIHTDEDGLARGYVAFSLAVERARSIALAPIEGWFELTQTSQNWRLFGTPGRVVSALRVTAHSAAGDAILYESGDPARRWQADFLEYRRIRALYKPSRRGPPPTYAAFGEQLSRRVFAELPHARRVSIALVQSGVRLPGEASVPGADERRPEHVLSFDRPPA